MDVKVYDEALLRLERPGRLSPLLPEDTNSDAQLADTAQTLMPWLLVFGVLGWWVARCLLRDVQPTRLGSFRHLLAWGLGWGAIFFMLGICPAETLGSSIQTTILAGGTLLLGIVFLVLVFRILASLCNRWAQGPELWVVVALIGVLTFWQVIVAGVPSLVSAAPCCPGQWDCPLRSGPWWRWCFPPSCSPPRWLRPGPCGCTTVGAVGRAENTSPRAGADGRLGDLGRRRIRPCPRLDERSLLAVAPRPWNGPLRIRVGGGP